MRQSFAGIAPMAEAAHDDDPIEACKSALFDAMEGGDPSAIAAAAQQLYVAREPLDPPATRATAVQLGALSVPTRGERDRRAHVILVRASALDAPPEARRALFDSVYFAAQDAVTRGVQPEEHFGAMLLRAANEAWPELAGAERRARTAAVLEWAHQGFARTGGSSHRVALHVSDALAIVLDEQGADDTILLAADTLERSAHVLGAGHEATLLRQIWLAELYANAQCFEEALGQARRAADTTRAQGNEEVLAAYATRLVGLLALRTGRVREGCDTLEAVRLATLVTRMRMPRPRITARFTFGPHDDEVVRAADDLRSCVTLKGFYSASTLSAVFRLARALEHARRTADATCVRALYERWLDAVLDARAERVFHKLDALGRALRDSGENAEAVRVLEKLVHWSSAKHGATHAQTSQARNALGLALGRLGRTDDALSVLGALSDDLLREHAHGALTVRSNYATQLLEAGRGAEALATFEDLARRARKAREPHEAEVADLGVALAAAACGDNERARSVLEPLFESLEGSDRLTTPFGARVGDALLTVLVRTHDWHAVELQERLVRASEARVGADHPAAWIERYNLGTVYAQLGEHAIAKRILVEMLARQERAFGPTASDAVRTRRALASVLEALGEGTEAKRLRAGESGSGSG